MKKLIFSLLTVFTLLITACKEEPEIGDVFEYNGLNFIVTSETTVSLNRNNSIPEAVIIIPETVNYKGKNFSVTKIGDSAFTHISNLTSVTIPNSVTSIGASAFANCTSLASVTIPNSVTVIGAMAFAGCSSLVRVGIPNSVTKIEYETFARCSALTSVEIPNSVTEIGIGAFQDCSALAKLYMGENIKRIYSVAFNRCKALIYIKIEAVVPPNIDLYTFDLSTNNEATLYVPKESINLYEKDYGNSWSRFQHIKSFN